MTLTTTLLFWSLVGAVCAFYLLIAIATPVLTYCNLPQAIFFYRLGHALCVQRPSRCLWLLHYHTALCCKCFGFYTGLLFFAVFYIFRRLSVDWRLGIIGFSLPAAVFLHGSTSSPYASAPTPNIILSIKFCWVSIFRFQTKPGGGGGANLSPTY